MQSSPACRVKISLLLFNIYGNLLIEDDSHIMWNLIFPKMQETGYLLQSLFAFWFNPYLSVPKFCRLLITFGNSLGLDQDQQNVGPDLEPICFMPTKMIQWSISGWILITTAPGENKKTGNVMQQPMHSCICGINLRSESSLVLSELLFILNRCIRIRQ